MSAPLELDTSQFYRQLRAYNTKRQLADIIHLLRIADDLESPLASELDNATAVASSIRIHVGVQLLRAEGYEPRLSDDLDTDPGTNEEMSDLTSSGERNEDRVAGGDNLLDDVHERGQVSPVIVEHERLPVVDQLSHDATVAPHDGNEQTDATQEGASAMSDEDQAIATKVRVELARRNIKQNAVAKAIGMSQQSFNNRVKGSVPFSAAELLLVASVIDIPAEELFRTDTKASA